MSLGDQESERPSDLLLPDEEGACPGGYSLEEKSNL
jgi:hypothetical protein